MARFRSGKSLPAGHPSRHRILSELHARPFAALPPECRLLHFAFLVTADEACADSERIRTYAAHRGENPGEPAGRYLLLDQGRLRWERHGEFVTYTMVVAAGATQAWHPVLIPPGQLVVAVDLHLGRDAGPRAIIETQLVDGAATFASNLKPNAAGFVEIRIAHSDMSRETAGATVQRILELETYRCLALLGLPVAEEVADQIGRIEAQLPGVMEEMKNAGSLAINRNLLERLTAMSFALEQSSSASHFRFGATRAYAELVYLRLTALHEIVRSGDIGLKSFLSRRFNPCVRSCEAVTRREEVLARKLTRAAQLLRTRVDIALQSQNRDLLMAMDDTARRHLRLQTTVESVSVVAITYYIASLVHLLLEGAHSWIPALDANRTTAAAIPFIAFALIAGLSRWKRPGA